MSDPAGDSMTDEARSGAPRFDVAAYQRQLRLVWVVVVAAGLGAVLADGRPTGLVVVDAFWRFAFAAVVTLAASYAKRWTWMVVAGAAAAGAVGADLAVVVGGLVVLAAAIVVALRSRRDAVLGAIVVAGAMQVLLRLPDVGPTGATAVLAALAPVPVLVSAYRAVGPSMQRRVRRGGLAVGAVLVVVLVPVAIAGVVTWRSGAEATTESRAWLDAAREGDQQAVLGHLATASDAFSDAAASTTAWYLAPARALPVVGPQLDAVATMAGNGRDIVEAATTAAEIADLQQLRVTGGRIDLDRLEALREPVAVVSARVESARRELDALDTTWLVAPVASRLDDFDDQLADASDDADLASATLDVLPPMLGSDGPRRYLVVFTSPAETRELGGFMGNWGELTVVDGELELTDSGRSLDLNDAAPPVPRGETPLADPDRYPARYLSYRPWTFWQNITGTPDFPTVAQMASELYPRATGRPIDGVFYIDPFGLAALLELTGPVVVDSLDMPLDTDNVADFLLREQYVRFPVREDRVDFLDEVSRVTFERLTSLDLPGPRQVGEALGPAVSAGQIQFWAFDPATHSLLERLGLDGALDPAPGDDSLMVTVANANPNKIDAYLHREIRYDAIIDEATGQVTATATVTLRNDAPLDLSDYVIGNFVPGIDLPFGTNRTYLSVYSPLVATAASIDGQPLAIEQLVEYGLNRAGAFIEIPPLSTRTITFELAGPLDLSEGYRLDLRAPALVHPDQMTVSVRDPDGGLVPVQVLDTSTAPAGDGTTTFDLRGKVIVVTESG